MSVRIRGTAISVDQPFDDVVVTVGDDGRIASIGHDADPADMDTGGLLIVPGFVDIHVHGGGGADFMDGTATAARKVARTHACFGTTSLLATSLTAKRPDIDRFIDAVREVMDSPGSDEARISGIHLEGPYICAAKRGAQPLGPIRAPDWDEMYSWIQRSRDAVRIVTIAPELPGSLDFIRSAVAMGVVVSVGHTNATYEQTVDAIDAGATHATHLFNAMTAIAHRAPGAAGALLTDNRVYAELIVDGVHLHPASVAMAMRCCGRGRTILVTDAIAGAAMPEGDTLLGGQTVIVRDGMASFADGTLAGSVLTMNRAFHNAIQQTGISACDAAAMSSHNAAASLGLAEDIGNLEPGCRADLAVIDPDSGTVAATMRDGKWLWRA